VLLRFAGEPAQVLVAHFVFVNRYVAAVKGCTRWVFVRQSGVGYILPFQGDALYGPKGILACRWADFSPGRSRAPLTASPEMERDSRRLDRPDVGERNRTRRRRIPGFRGTQTTPLAGSQLSPTPIHWPRAQASQVGHVDGLRRGLPISPFLASDGHLSDCEISLGKNAKCATKGKAYGALGNTLDAGRGECSVGRLAEIRKASPLPDSPVPANHARSPELERYATKGNLVHSEGLRVYKCARPAGQIGNPG
jgi:hypothetical protein